MTFTESDIEQAAIGWFTTLGYMYLNGHEIEPDAPKAERESFEQVLLPARLQAALARLNPGCPPPPWMTPSAKFPPYPPLPSSPPTVSSTAPWSTASRSR